MLIDSYSYSIDDLLICDLLAQVPSDGSADAENLPQTHKYICNTYIVVCINRYTCRSSCYRPDYNERNALRK